MAGKALPTQYPSLCRQQTSLVMHTITVGDEVTIYSADSLWTAWQPTLKEQDKVLFDCSGIQEFDSCGAQLFYFIQTKASQDHCCSVKFVDIPDDVRSDLSTLNMLDTLLEQSSEEA